MLHLDIKKLSRFRRPGLRATGDRTQNSPRGGWEFVHLALDDNSRFACADILHNESGRSACRALHSALRYHQQFGITFRRVLTDIGACSKSRRFARLCQRLGLRQRSTKPYTPQSNGKPERFTQTAFRGWANERPCDSARSTSAPVGALLQLVPTACQPSVSASNLSNQRTEQPRVVTLLEIKLTK